MSQPQVRKPQSIGGEKGRFSMVKASGDSAPCAPHQSQPKQHQSSRSKNKIPKSIRYDLENALVGLCDVWFEDIKPHLVRNKIKLHVDTNGARASGDFGRLPTADTACSHLDPGAASDRHQQTFADCAGCCSTQPTASKAQCLRPPVPRPPPSLRPPPSSPPPLRDRTSQNKNSRSKSPRRTRSPTKPQPPPFPSSNWRVPRLCRTYSLPAPKASPGTHIRRIKTASPVTHTREGSCLLALVPRRRTSTRNKYTQTNIPYETKSYAQHRNSMKRTYTEPIPCDIHKAPALRHQHTINLMNTETVPPKNVQPQRRNLEKRLNIRAYPPLRNPSPVKQQNTEMRREVPVAMDIDSVPSRTRRYQSPPKRKKKEPIPIKTVPSDVQRHRSQENRPSTNSAPQQLHKTREKRIDPSIAPHPRHIEEKRSHIHLPARNPSPMTQPNGHQFWRCFATTNLNPLKNKKQESHKNQRPDVEPSMLFDKELIDIIGSNNDKRLRVLYQNDANEEYTSVMNLVASTNDREKEATSTKSKRTLPWR